MTIAYPLQWPFGIKRTPPLHRRPAMFGKMKTVRSTGPSGQALGWNKKESLTVADAASRLYLALEKLGADSVVISSNLTLNLDGSPRSSQREPDDVGVCLYFRREGHQYALPCDKWDRTADNLAAIAGHIEAIRSQERWGVGTTEQAFAGFEALPPPKTWRDVLGFSPARPVTADDINAKWRTLSQIRHPDRSTGSHAAMAELNAARDQALQEIPR